MSNEKVFEVVREVLADVLELDLSEIGSESKLVDDLGADSLDIVDLSFSLSKKFNIKMPQSSVIAAAEEMVDDMALIVKSDRVTALGAELLQRGPNAYRAEEVYEGKTVSEIFTETKVQHWVNLCTAVLESGKTGDELVAQTIQDVVISRADASAVA